MKRTLVCALVLALALPATATAGLKTYRLKGPVVGDPNAMVWIDVVMRNGKPKRSRTSSTRTSTRSATWTARTSSPPVS